MPYSLAYVSQATAPLSDAQLKLLLDVARARNKTLSITGALAYSNGWFFQVLEGEEADVKTVFASISQDSRHGDLTIIVDYAVAERAFADWSMAVIHSHQTENDTRRNVSQIRQRATIGEKFDSVAAFHTFIAPPRLAIQPDF